MAKRTLLTILFISLFLVACVTPEPVVRTDQYHKDAAPEQKPKALNGLQLKALQLMNQMKFEQAILYLQRAIKVEPRDPLNWHYLAQNYWHLKDFKSCRSMVNRAISYSQFNEALNKSNLTLLKQCDG